MRCHDNYNRKTSFVRTCRRCGFSSVTILLGLLLLIIILGLIGTYFHRLDRQLREAIVEIERTDPGWRLEQIEAKRKKIADKDNGTKVVVAVRKLLPKEWGDTIAGPVFQEIDALPPAMQLSPQQAASVKTLLRKSEKALVKAREMVHYTKGNYPTKWTEDVVSTSLDHTQHCRDVAYLLHLDILRQCRQQKLPEAWQSCRAIFHTEKTIGDEPTMVSQLVRMALRSIAVSSLERVLAQGELPPKLLVEAQELLQAEVKEPLLYYAFRGERATSHQICLNLQNGKIPLPSLEKDLGGAKVPKFVEQFSVALMVKPAHLYLLNTFTRILKLKELSDYEQRQAFENIDDEIKEGKGTYSIPIIAGLLMPAVMKVADAGLRTNTHLHCAIVGMALEQYRLKHKRWPKNLNELVKDGLLKKIPIDPFSGKPLKYRQSKNGVVVYSLWNDPNYQGEQLDNPVAEDHEYRVQFRLWNVPLRRQATKGLKDQQ